MRRIVKVILEVEGIDKALAYLCIVCDIAPVDARIIIYELI